MTYCSLINMMNSWFVFIIAFSSKLGFVYSFIPADREPMNRGTQLFQSSIATQKDFFRQDVLCSRKKSFNIRIDEVRRSKTNNKEYSSSNDCKKNNANLDPNKKIGYVHSDGQLTLLRSKSLKDLKLMCSRRNIQYGKFLEKEDYIEAIRQDMEQEFAFSVTGVPQPGAMVELTDEQLEQEISGKKTLIVVEVFADWCGPCRAVVPQLETAAKKLAEQDVRVVKINVDKYPSLAAKYKIEGLPAILFIQTGYVLRHLEGMFTTEEILVHAHQHLA